MAKQTTKEEKKQREKNARKATYIGAALGLFVVGVIGVIVWIFAYSPNLTVYTVGDYEVKKDFYTCVYCCDTLKSKNWSFEYDFDATKDPYEQEYNYYAGGVKYDTWGDYFEKLTNDTVRFLVVMNDTAEKGGYTFTEKVQENIDADMQAIEDEKEPKTSFKDYMLEEYGAPIEKDTYLQYLTMYYRAREFYGAITESKALFNKYIGGNASAFEKVYEQKKERIDVVSFRYCYLPMTDENASMIDALKNADSEKEFKDLCNAYHKADENYVKNDKSLYKNMSLRKINDLAKGGITDELSDAACKAGDIYTNEATLNGEPYIDIVYVVKPAGKDTTAYKDTDVQKWEFAVMGEMLEDYYDANYESEISEKGIKEFRKSIIVPKQDKA
ncbi:MAG: hypothetical protein IKE65_03660 [Clostridia bacterium]|nr:hypothetical protein [Clostridia bacterium]